MQEAAQCQMLAQLLARGRCGAGRARARHRLRHRGHDRAPAQAVGPSGHVTGADISRPMLDAARRRVDENGLANVDTDPGRCAGASVRSRYVRPGDVAARGHVLRRSGCRFQQLAPRVEAGGSAGHGGMGDDRREHPLEDPVRDRGAPSRAARAPTAACAGTARLWRPRLPARYSRRAGYAAISIEPRRFDVHGDRRPPWRSMPPCSGWCSG